MHVGAVPAEAREGTGTPGAGVTGSCIETSELGSSARAVLVLHQAVSPAPWFLIFKNYRYRTSSLKTPLIIGIVAVEGDLMPAMFIS